ncbi:FAD-binding oxidoreductase [Aliidiomarina halalkaliphila]|uniref:D-2-hydroxyglutarate dehydrogenase n=1 Tax=Aliidiomarina halalkaliphila TaxID=2593535 RepID=A0A552X6D3_9GAMM|nr:FAD-binding and (Fe-S)-binding domain-containing protein [Aliidiomarina halalkaliphila]TRW50520.1 FAD-binding oxidoreductase [Aliidiomarina halalkaliphila]
MLATISPDDPVVAATHPYLEALRKSGFIGDIDVSYSGRLIAATDNSIYQQLPQAVLYPRSQRDVACALKVAQQKAFRHIRFAPRGGGTGTNGQSLTPGIVIDLSRYLNRVLEINAKEGWVRVEAGIVKDQLNAALADDGYFFAPDTSTSNRCTIGGMIATDASGQGSLVYGKTSDHVLALRGYLANGEEIRTAPMPRNEAESRANEGDTLATIYRQVLDTCVGLRAEIAEKFPPLNRFLTGYDLAHAYNESRDEIDIGRLICGAEGTLAIVTECKLNITPIPAFKVLVNVKYQDFQAALKHAPSLVAAEATSVETIDSTVLDLARNDVVWHEVRDLLTDVPPYRMDGINILEFTGLTQQEIGGKLKRLCTELDQLDPHRTGVIGYQICRDGASIHKIYNMRKKAVGLLGATKGSEKPVAFVEDTAVPPENLADYIMEFRAILDRYGLHYGMFGHVDAGVLHVRPALDMQDPASAHTLRDISDEVVALTARFGGLMWGEHGKGFRSEYGPEFFGDRLFTELRKIKGAFDPRNLLNPGKICTPIQRNEPLVSIDGPLRGTLDRQISKAHQRQFQGVMDCNGNGLCFNFDADATMCPSFRATGDRRYSPKGRATLIREWLRLHSHADSKLMISAESLPKEPGVLANIWLAPAKGNDFNHEVRDSLDNCLACKACSSQCPVKVDIPSQRSLFYGLYHTRFKRPLKDFVVQRSESSVLRLARFPRLANLFVQNPFSRWLQKQLLGYQDTPRFAIPSLRTHSQLLQVMSFADAQKKHDKGEWDKDAYVFIVQDAYTSAFDAQVVADFVAVARSIGKTPVLLPFMENGKAAHVKGFLRSFYNKANRTSAFLAQVQKQFQAPLVAMDAASGLVYRDEYRKLGVAQAEEFDVHLMHEWLKEHLTAIASRINDDHRDNHVVQVLVHCTEQSMLANSRSDWATVLQNAGIRAEAPAVGCCGMAGTFGHESEHQKTSKALWEMSWQPKFEDIQYDQLYATGFSCRCQGKRMQGQGVKHPVALLAQRLRRAPR